MSGPLRFITLLVLLSFCFVVSCDKSSSNPSKAAPAAAKVKKVKVGSRTMTLEEVEEVDVEAKPTAQATK